MPCTDDALRFDMVVQGINRIEESIAIETLGVQRLEYDSWQ